MTSAEGSGIPLVSDVTTTYDVTTPMTNGSGVHSGGHSNYFNLGGHEFVLLIRQLKINNYQELGYTCAGVLVLSFIYELLKNVRQMLIGGFFSNAYKIQQNNFLPSSGDCCNDDDVISYYVTKRNFWCSHFMHSFLYVIQVFLAFVLMLIVMTYNVYLLAAVLAGNLIGYFVCGVWRRHLVVKKLKYKSQVYTNETAGRIIQNPDA